MGWSSIIIVALAASAYSQEICLSGDDEPYLLFGTKTAYIFANNGGSYNSRTHDVPGCQPISIWMLNRHGSHNPEADEIVELQKLSDLKQNIMSNYKNGNFRDTNQRICSSDLNLLERWEWNYRHNLTYAGDLTSDGYMTTQQLAQAWKQKYPGLFTNNRYNYMFQFVNDKRSSNTFRSFTEGLFGDQADTYDIPKENNEKLLRPYKFCPAWTRDVENNNSTLSQVQIFESKREYKEMITNVSLRLGFNYDMQKETIQHMYQLCRYNKAWDVSNISPWCAAFTREDLKRLEYAEDLETYYKYGYGNENNQKLGCTLVKDMLTFFENHIAHEVPQQPKARVHFAEAPALLLALAALGARRDAVPLTGDNYNTNPVQARKWTTSTMTPFNANIAAVLYQCTPNGNFQVKDEYQVLFMENEKPLYVEGCRVGLCDWSFVKSKYADIISKCDLEFCNGATKTNSIIILSVAMFFITRMGLLC